MDGFYGAVLQGDFVLEGGFFTLQGAPQLTGDPTYILEQGHLDDKYFKRLPIGRLRFFLNLRLLETPPPSLS